MTKKDSQVISTIVTATSSNPDRLLTPAEVCLLLSISKKTLDRLRLQKPPALSYIKLRGGFRYRRAAVDFYINRNEVKAVA